MKDQSFCLSTQDESYIHLQFLMKSQKKISIKIVEKLPDSIEIVLGKSAAPVIKKDIAKIFQRALDWTENIQSICWSCDQAQERYLTDWNILNRMSKRYANLCSLSLWNILIGDKGVNNIKQIKFDSLETLILVYNSITKEGVKILASCDYKRLKHLILQSNKIGNKGLQHLVKAKWNNLNFISLCSSNITNDALRLITKAVWPKLQQVFVFSFEVETAISLFEIHSIKDYAKKFVPALEVKDKSYHIWMVRINECFQKPEYFHYQAIFPKSRNLQ